jgi:hypothetical protein
VRSSSAVGLDGHQWNLQRAAGARLPCRALCECGWTSTAGQRTEVLLELKGHLEQARRTMPGTARNSQTYKPGGDRDNL